MLEEIGCFVEHARVPAERREIKSADYMNLQFMVKRFYDTSVKVIPEAKNTVPEYPKYELRSSREIHSHWNFF